jgi:ubiquinone/menaquinone biosynthesis C-methylase UbiE
MLCACGGCAGSSLIDPRGAAEAMVKLVEPEERLEELFDVEREARLDQTFAKGMNTMMGGFEDAVRERKLKLFDTLLEGYDGAEEVSICEIGAGTLPNGKYLARAERGPKRIDLVAIDPNDSMRAYAEENLKDVQLANDREIDLRFRHGVGEALPLEDGSVDALISTLTLCSVRDPEQTMKEIKRVLKPGGKFLFLEHVLSESDPKFAALQEKLTPMQIQVADGCHLNRRTLETIQNAGFKRVDAEYYELDGFWVIAPQVCGIAEA